jgi:hypothetical protein
MPFQRKIQAFPQLRQEAVGEVVRRGSTFPHHHHSLLARRKAEARRLLGAPSRVGLSYRSSARSWFDTFAVIIGQIVPYLTDPIFASSNRTNKSMVPPVIDA